MAEKKEAEVLAQVKRPAHASFCARGLLAPFATSDGKSSDDN